MRNHVIVASIAIALSTALFAQQPAWEPAPGHITLALWPNGAPASSSPIASSPLPSGPGTPTQGTSNSGAANPDTSSKPGAPVATGTQPEVILTNGKGGLVAGKPFLRLTNVSAPTLTLYAPSGKSPETMNSGAAVVVFPGGGYRFLSIDLEGTEVCDWLNSAGINCILVKYRVPGSGPFPKSAAALEDAQRAISLVRSHAAEWQIDPQRIGVLGFSAGGYLAAAASTHFDQRVYAPVDAVDQLSCRPDFAILVYPAYLAAKSIDGGSNLALNADVHITGNTPPTLLFHAEDDPAAPVENSLAYFLALKAVKIPAEMHIYTQGGHGFGLRPTALPITTWPRTAEIWLRTSKILSPPAP